MTPEYQKQLQDNVKCGALYLDNLMPGWQNKINLTDLRMQHSDCCIVGQLELDLDYCSEVLGFYPPETYDYIVDYSARQKNWNYLQKLWIEEIEQRKERLTPIEL